MAGFKTSWGKSAWFNPRENCSKRFYPDNSSSQSAEYAVWVTTRDQGGKLPAHDFTRIEHEHVVVDGKRQKRARWLVLFKGDDPANVFRFQSHLCRNDEVARYEIPNWDWIPTVCDVGEEINARLRRQFVAAGRPIPEDMLEGATHG